MKKDLRIMVPEVGCGLVCWFGLLVWFMVLGCGLVLFFGNHSPEDTWRVTLPPLGTVAPGMGFVITMVSFGLSVRMYIVSVVRPRFISRYRILDIFSVVIAGSVTCPFIFIIV